MARDGEGTPFGRYRLIELLGRGGMGEVWRAYDPVNERFVALKVLPVNFANDEVFQERFRREARAAAGLDEPHVVPIYDSGEIDGRLFVSMRLVRGRELQELLEAGPLPPARVVGIIEQVAAALHAAHEVGLVHRDVKPSNILVSADDFSYLIDFGIARAAGEAGLTSVGSTIGTWAYMAPERFTDSAVADARADTYALACVLHQGLTGQQPFPVDGIEQVAMAHMMEPPPRPSRLRAGVPEAMDEVIAVGMAKDPRRRYATTRDLARAARAALHAAPRRPAPPPPTRPPPQYTPPQYTPPPARSPYTPPPAPMRIEPEPATERAAPLTPPPEPVPTVAQWAASPPAYLPAEAPPTPAPAEPKAQPNAQPNAKAKAEPKAKPKRRRRGLILASLAVTVTVAVVAGVVALVLTNRHQSSGPQLLLPFTGLNHPGGLAVDGNGAVYVVDSGNNRVLSLAPGSREQTVLGFGDLKLPHGVAVDSSGVVYVVDTGDEQVIKLDPSGGPSALSFTGLNGPQGVAVDGNGTVYVTDSGARRVLSYAAGASEQTVLAFTDLYRPDGVAVDSSGSVYVTDVGNGNHRVVKLDAASGTETVLPFTSLSNPAGVAVDSGGAVYVADRDNHRVVKLDVASGTQTVLPLTGLKWPYGVVVDGIGDVYVTDNGNNRVVKLPHR